MPIAQRYLLGLAAFLGYLYIALLVCKPYPLSWLLKPLPMLLFAWLVWRNPGGVGGRCLAAGFIAAAAGDFFLDYGNRDGLFTQALLAFLLTQVAFIGGFLQLGHGRPWRCWWSLPVIVYTASMTAWMLPGTGTLQVPVALYFLGLLGMALAAVRVTERPGRLWAGALLFLLADSLIGVNKFIQPFPYAVPVIVTLYFTGQLLIAWGLLRLSASPATSPGVSVAAD